MNGYNLKRPCPDCPFRSDNDVASCLAPGRIDEIEQSLIRGEFHCHETVAYDESHWEADEDGDEHYIPTGEEQHCAGALILLEKLERPSQMMRIMERLGFYNRKALDMDAPVVDSFDEMKQ